MFDALSIYVPNGYQFLLVISIIALQVGFEALRKIL